MGKILVDCQNCFYDGVPGASHDLDGCYGCGRNGYINYKVKTNMINIMKTNCLRCGSEFDLTLDTVYVGTERHAPHDDVAVVKCPHCEKREEF